MNILILGGESARHAGWVRDVKHAVQPSAEKARCLDYLHWETRQPEIDLETEITRAGHLAETVQPDIVVAKSIGTIVASLAIQRGLMRPKACVFLGFPLRVLDRCGPDILPAVAHLPPTTFVQNEEDKVGSADELRGFLEEIEPSEYTCIKVPGNATHDYIDFIEITRLIRATGVR